MTRVADVRRRVAHQAHGAVRLLNWVQASLGDVEGALEAGQLGVAAVQARQVVLECLAVRSLATEGELDFAVESVSFDVFAGIAEEEVESALALAREALDVEEAGVELWLARLHAFVADTETALGYDTPLPDLRSRDGAFGLLGLARRWAPVLDELGLPPLLPLEWISADSTDHGRSGREPRRHVR